MRKPRPRERAGARVLLLNKPFGVLCQFSPSTDRATLADYVPIPDVYPAGRLDADSEGLVVLTDDGALQHRLADPHHKMEKRYWVEVERVPSAAALEELRDGVEIGGRRTRAARVRALPEPPALWPRDPPVRFRRQVPTAWLELGLREGRNRQIRRMTAAVGHPTLRLVRIAVGPFELGRLSPGEWREATPPMVLE